MTIYDDAQLFLKKLFNEIHNAAIDLKNWEIDHICYRTSSWENYQNTKMEMEKIGVCLVESDVNGRPIATYKLHHPIRYQKYIIDLVEVPAPKKGKMTKEGLEHVEVVIDIEFQELLKLYPNCQWDRSGVSKKINPELEIEFLECAIKFHYKSLEHIINIENHKLIEEFFQKSNFFHNFSDFSPCISGTLPLLIHTETSDLDILFFSRNLERFKQKAKQCFKNEVDFSVKETIHQGLTSLVINFNFKDLKIEFFCQDKPVYQQQANQHFLIEGRILKLLGKDFKEKIIKLKKQGIKTEPAFGQLLNLNKPYQDLIKLNQMSDLEISRLSFN
jgi:uncharacterized protein